MAIIESTVCFLLLLLCQRRSPFVLWIHISFDQVCFPSGDFEVPCYYFAVLDFKWQWGLNGPYIEAFVIGNYYSAFNNECQLLIIASNWFVYTQYIYEKVCICEKHNVSL